MRMRKKMLIVACIIGTGACQDQSNEMIVATVGRERLTLRDIESRIPLQLVEKITIQEKRFMVQKWIEDELLYGEAKKQKLDVDPRVANRIATATQDILIAELLDREFRKNMEVFNDEIGAYYETHREEFIREQPEIRARHILVRSRSDQKRVRKDLRNGQLFDQMAREGLS